MPASQPEQETPVILLIADISGYTAFMVKNRFSLYHGQAIISELTKAIIREIEIPLEIAKFEGDAIFFYARKSDDETQWNQTKKMIGQKLFSFFRAFHHKAAELQLSNTCHCEVCSNVRKLGLKVVVHSGTALFYEISNFRELSGVDVIIVHRLLKNKVKQKEYILLTEQACCDIELQEESTSQSFTEVYDSIGEVKTTAYYPPVDAIRQNSEETQQKPGPAIILKNLISKISTAMLMLTGIKKQDHMLNLPETAE
ncbi:MAG: DUF2652 domain-containing protein [Firmicutes bacterium]|nr:DUF2652 domain-containing protein [Bacillota bacterium]